MGQRSATETLFGIVAAFVEQRTWAQANLARHLETTPATVRKRLRDLQAGGFKLTCEFDHPHTYWSVSKDWFPGAVAFKADEVDDLLRVLARAPQSAQTKRVLDIVLARLGSLGRAGPREFDVSTVRAAVVDPTEEEHLSVLEDAGRKKVAQKMRYFTASRRDDAWRHVSVHRIDLGSRARFLATCHRSGKIQRFRVSNVGAAVLDRSEAFRAASQAALAKFDEESFSHFHEEGPAVRCAFFVRDPDAAWVARNLPDRGIAAEPARGGTRFVVETSAVRTLARFVVGLGASARAETPELAREVRELAKAALGDG